MKRGLFCRRVFSRAAGPVVVGVALLGGADPAQAAANERQPGDEGDAAIEAPIEHVFAHLGRVDGLVSDRVRAVHQTEDGTVWVGTESGLSAYDGSTKLTVSLPSTSGLPGGNATVTALAGSDELWIGRASGGLDRLDLRTMRISQLPVAPGSALGFPDPVGATTSLAEDDDMVWVGTGSSGLAVLDTEADRFQPVRGTDGPVEDLALDDGRDLVWVVNDGRLVVVDRGDRRVAASAVLEPTRSPPIGTITAVAVDPTGVVWVGNENGALFRLGVGDERWSLMVPLPGPGYAISAIATAPDRSVWVGRGDDVISLDSSGSRPTLYAGDGAHESLSGGETTDVTADASGVIWVAKRGSGIYFLDPAPRAARWLTVPAEVDRATRRNHVTNVVDAGSHVFVTTMANPELIDISSGRRTVVAGGGECANAVAIVPGETIWCVGKDLWSFSVPDNRWVHLGSELPRVLGAATPAVVPDGSGGAWLLTAVGAALIDADGRVVRSGALELRGSVPEGSSVTDAVMVGPRIFVSGEGFGIAEFHPGTLVLRPFGAVNRTPPPPSGRVVVDLSVDDLGRLLAVGNSGLDVYEASLLSVTRWGARDGLANQDVVGVTAVGKEIWVVRDAGIDRVDPTERSIRRMTAEDGLEAAPFSRGAVIARSDHAVVVGGAVGINVIDPNAPLVRSCDRQAQLSTLDAWSRRALRNPDVATNGNVPTARLEFAQPCYSRRDASQLRFRVDGGRWTVLPTGEFTVNAPLDGAGLHLLEVQGADRRGGWVPRPVTVKVEAETGSWDRGLVRWFIGLGLVVVVSEYAWVHLWRTRRLNRHLEERVEAQTGNLRRAHDRLEQALSDQRGLIDVVAHDVRAPLVRQMTYLQMMEAEPAVADARVIRREAERMDEMLSQLLLAREGDSLNGPVVTRPVNISEVLHQAVERAQPAADHKDIRLSLVVSAPDLEVQATETILDEVLDNLLSNAVKYSYPASTVHIAAEPAADHEPGRPPVVVVRIRDHGVGVDAADAARLFTRFGRGAQRPTGGEGSTGLGLYAVRRLLRRIGAEVHLSSAGPGLGTTAVCVFDGVESPTASDGLGDDLATSLAVGREGDL